jgi:trans-aconitate 2-methyltransferase
LTKQPEKYSWNAEDYAKHSTTQQQWAKELIPKLKLTGNEALLDIGCGDGKITAQIASCLPNGYVVGVDSSEEMVKLARNKFPQTAFPNVSFQMMDARKLTFNEQFDRVFSNAALHWIIDHRPVLFGVRRSLKPGGRLLFQMGGKGNAQAILGLLDELMVEERWCQFFTGFTFHYGFYTPEEYVVWLREAGLEPEQVELLKKDMALQGKEGLAGWVRTTWLPYTGRLPADMRDEFVNEIVSRYVKAHPLDAQGYVHMAMVRLEVGAYKT